jgi:hypothetical protein
MPTSTSNMNVVETTPFPHVLFQELCEIKDRKKRVEHLKNNGNNFFIKTILQLAWNDNVKLDIPSGKPPNLDPEKLPTDDEIELEKAIQLISPIGQCVVNSPRSAIEKENIFTQIMSGMPKESGEILVAAKDGNILTVKSKKYSKITKPLVSDAFPDIF